MTIGIFIYSQTKNTLSITERIHEKLDQNHHEATLVHIKTQDGKPFKKEDIRFQSLPDHRHYDTFVIESPVHAFSVSLPMSAFLKQIDAFEQKKIILFVTQRLARPWMGGNQAISLMKDLCISKEGRVIGSHIINWNSQQKDKQISYLIESTSALV